MFNKNKINYNKQECNKDKEKNTSDNHKKVKELNVGVRRINEKFLKYQKNPVAFCEEVLKETFPDRIKELMMGIVDNRISIAKSSTGFGKCKVFGEYITLTNGSIYKVEDLIDKSFEIYSVDKDLNQKVSLAYATNNGEKESLEIITNSGKAIRATNNHPIISTNTNFKKSKKRNSRNLDYCWKNLEELKIGDYILTVEDSPYEGKEFLEDYKVKLLAYLIGDACSSNNIVSTQNPGKVLDEFTQCIKSFDCILQSTDYKGETNGLGYRVVNKNIEETASFNPIIKFLKENNFFDKNSFEKFLPQIVYQLNNKQLALFLSRLYTTDGWTCIRKSKRNNTSNYISKVGEIGYSSVSKKLCEDIQRLLLRFGIVAKLRKKKTTCTDKKKKKYSFAYSLDIHDSAMIIKFVDKIGIFGKEEALSKTYLLAKSRVDFAQKSIKNTKGMKGYLDWYHRNIPEGYRWEVVKEINNLGLQSTVCITVPGDETYLTEFVEHNSYAAARLAIWFLKCFPGSKVFLSAAPPEDNLKRLLWGQIELLRIKHPDLFIGDTFKSLELAIDSEWYIAGLTIPNSGTEHEKVAKFSGKHAPYLFFILDEGDAIPDACYKGIEGCMSGGYARILIMFNPRHQTGYVYTKEKRSEGKITVLSAFEHPNVITGKDIYPGALTREETVRRINMYSRPVVEGDDLSHSVYELPPYLIGATAEADDKSIYPELPGGLRKITDPSFSYMVLGQYPEQSETQLISVAWVKKAQERWLDYVKVNGDKYPVDQRPILGLDVAEMGADYNVVCMRYGNYVLPFEAWNGMDADQTAVKAIDLYYKSKAEKAFIDCMNVGHSLPTSMQKAGCNAIGIKVNTSPTKEVDLGGFEQLTDQLYWSVREWLKDETQQAMLPPDKMLEEELLALEYSIPQAKIKVTPKLILRNQLRRSTDRLDALALTFSQESDKLLHFYENVIVCEIDKETKDLVIKYDEKNIINKSTETPGNIDRISLGDMMDFGFISCTKDFSAWAICRIWLSSSGKVIIPDLWRIEANDPRLIVEKVFEAHNIRPFRCVGTYSELRKFLKPHWNDLENEIHKASVDASTPELTSVKITDRLHRQLIIKDIAKLKGAGVLRNVVDKKEIWSQFGHCESKPDDCRDALAGAIRLMLKQT